MPEIDLDDELAALRADLRESLPVPGMTTVRRRAKQRVVRRRMQIGAVVAVVAVSAAVPALRPHIVPDPAPAGSPPASRPAEPTYPKGPFVSGFGFADADHGYAVRATCAKDRSPNCQEKLLATSDGEHWESRSLPRPKESPSWALGQLRVLGPDEVTVDWSLSPTNERTYRAHSVDGGRTWQAVPVPPVVTDTVDSIPDGGLLAPGCAVLVGGSQQCSERTFVVEVPGSGASARLANEPPLTAMLAGDIPTADGQWWVVGRDPKTEHWGIALSDDDGRTWRTTVLDWRGSVYAGGWSVAASGGTLYASAIGALPNASNGLVAVFRSTDGGRSWERTWVPDDDKQPRRVYNGPIAAADGTLVVSTIGGDAKTYTSHDGGRTFTEAPDGQPGGAIWTRIGYVASAGDSGKEYLTSPDGLNWRKLTIG